jgi:hypothetical protein
VYDSRNGESALGMHALETGNADVAALSGLSYTFVTPSQIRVYCFFCKALIMGFDVNRGWFKTTPRNAVPSIYTKELWFLISRTQGCFNSGHWHDYSRNWAMAHPKVPVSKTTPGYRMYSMRASSVMLNPARFDRALYTGPLRLETPSDGNCHALVTSCTQLLRSMSMS